MPILQFRKGNEEMKRILAMTIAVCMGAAMLGSCGGSDDSSSSSKAEVKAASAEINADEESTTGEDSGSGEPDAQPTDGEDSEAPEEEPEETPPTADEISAQLLAQYPAHEGAYDVKNGADENMLGRAILNRGDTSRLAQKIDHAVNNPKEMTKICYLGDSITAGSGASSSRNTYVSQVHTWWEENISFYIESVNAGIGATDSYTGVHRASRDCLPEEADIIVIEFINDGDSPLYEDTMDSLLRMCLSQPNDPAVIVLEPSCEGGSSPQNAHFKSAQAYGVPVISYHNAVQPEIQAGNFTWADISPDNVHPNDSGHTIMAQCVTSLFAQLLADIESEEKTPTPFDPSTESVTGDIFANATLGTRNTPETVKVTDEGSFTESASFQSFFTDGWGTTTGGSATFEITARNIGILFEKKPDGSNGTLAVKVDGGDAVLIDGSFPDGWGDWAKSEPIFTSDETATHTVTVEVIDGDAQSFKILSWLVS